MKLGASDLRGLRGGVPGYGSAARNRVSIGGNLNAVAGQTLQPGGDVNTFANTQLRQPAGQRASAVPTPATFALSLFSATANRFLNLELSALEADGKGKIVSSPRVITADQVKALIEQGTNCRIRRATSSGATAIEFRKANLKLEVTPQITPEGNVILDVDSTRTASAADHRRALRSTPSMSRRRCWSRTAARS